MAITPTITDFVRKSRKPGVVDQTKSLSPLWMDLWKNKQAAGGGAVEWSIRYRPNNRTIGWGEFAEAKVQKKDVITTPTLSTIDIAEPVDISINRMKKIKSGANGADGLVNYLNEMSQASEDSILEFLSQSIFTTGVTVSNADGEDLPNLTGLGGIVSSSSTYGGIAVADCPYWASNVIGSTTTADNGDDGMTAATYLGITIAGTETLANLMTTTHNAYLGKLLSTVVANCTWGADRPNLIVTNIGAYSLIEQTLMPSQRYPQDVGYGGFKGIYWQGIPVVVDRKCPARCIFVLTTKYLELRANPGMEITFDPFEKRPGTDVLTGMWKFTGQMVCTSRRHQGGIFNLPTA